MPLDDDEPEISFVNVLDYYKAHGIGEAAAIAIVLHLVLSRSYAAVSDAREAALELGYELPYVMPSDGRIH